MTHRQPVSRQRSAAALLAALLALGPAATVHAAAPSAEEMGIAKQRFQAGVKNFQSGRYPEAATDFQEAYRLSRRPDLLYNLGRVAEAMNKPRQAVDYLEGYLRERPDAPDRAEVKREIERLKKRSTLVETPPPPPAVVAPQRQLPPWPALGLAGGGAALLITGIALGGAALSTANQVESSPVFNRDLDARGRSLQSAAIALDVIGVAALGAGAGWITWWYFKGRAPAGPRAALLPLGLGAQWVGTF